MGAASTAERQTVDRAPIRATLTLVRSVGVERSVRVHEHDRAEIARTHAAGLDDLDFPVEVLFLEFVGERVVEGGAA